MPYYFYCPNCGYEQSSIKKLPKGGVSNIRDGYGRPIYHYECPKCGNLDAGAMQIEGDDDRWKSYCRVVIGSYQGVRWFASEQQGKDCYHE